MSSSINNLLNPSGPNAHPGTEVLAEFANGQLDEVRLGEIEAHLDECPSCCQALAKLSKQQDRFVSELVSAAKTDDRVAESTGRHSPGGQDDTLSFADDMPPKPPRRIGRFHVRKELGHGGFGVVLLADDPQLRREVAVKIPRLGFFLTLELRERFLREAQAAAALDHPNIVPIYEAGEADGVCYIASSYCRGPNLAAWLKKQTRPVGFETAARLVAELAVGVEHAHARGVLHRDLKPSNVLLERSDDGGRRKEETAEFGSFILHPSSLIPKITDFGMAKLDGDGPDATRSNIVMGTAGYMSPEQAGGGAKDITAASDIYSLGAILYELLTGRPPLVGDSDLETLQRVQNEEPITPARLRPKLPPDLETICLTCLQKEPRRRYASASGLADDLRRFLDGQVIRARPIGRLERLARWCRRRPALATLSASVVLLLAALVGGSVVSSIWLREQQHQTLAQLRETRKAQGEAVAAGSRAVREEQAAKRELFASLLSEARARRTAGRAGQKLDSLHALEQAAALIHVLDLGNDDRLRLRNEVIACLPLTDVRVDRTWPAYPPGSSRTGIAFDHNMQRYAKIDSNGRLVVRRMEDNIELWSLDIDAPRSRSHRWWLLLGFSPDGNYLIARGRDMAGNSQHMIPTRIWDLRTQKLAIEPLPPGVRDDVFDFDFSPDSRCLVAGRKDGAVAAVELASGESRTLLPMGTSPRMLRFDPSGQRIAVCLARETHIVDAESGQVAVKLAQPAQVVAWTSDGAKLATGVHGSTFVWDSRSGALLATCSTHQSEVVVASFLPESNTLATTSWADTRLWDAVSGRELLLIERGNAATFGRDARWLGLGSSGSEVGRFEVSLPEGFRTLGEKVNGRLEISADGRLLLASEPGRLLFWDVPSGQLIGTIALPNLNERLHAWFDAGGESVLTASVAGLHQWPICWERSRVSQQHAPTFPTAEANVRGRLVVGPPRRLRLSPPMQITGFLRGADGRFLLSDGYEVRVLNVPAQGEPQTVVSVRHGGWWMAVSNDGRWLATSQWHRQFTRVWDLKTGRLAHKIAGINAQMAFSPDNRTLVIGNPGRYEIYEVESWKQRRTIECVDMGVGRPISFSRDGKLLAISASHETVKLLDGESLEELGSFVAPTMERLGVIQLSPDGQQLVAKTASGVIHTWDLHRIRARLAEMGLEWQTPGKPGNGSPSLGNSAADAVQKASSGVDHISKIELHVDLGELGSVEQLSAQLASASEYAEPTDDADLAELYFQRGQAHQRVQQWQKALADLNKAIELSANGSDRPDRAEMHFQRGAVYSQLGRADQALTDYTQAIELNPKNSLSRYQRGAIYDRGRQWDKALTDYEASRRLAPQDGNSWRGLGQMQLQLGRWKEAVETLNEAAKWQATDWDLSRTLTLRGMAHYRQGHYAAALSDGERAFELDPENYLRSNALAWALAVCPTDALRDANRAVELSRHAIDLFPQNGMAWNTLGVAYYRQGRFDRALEALDESMKLRGGGDPFDWFFLAMSHWQQGNEPDACRWFDKSVQWIAEHPPADPELTGFRAEAEMLLKK